MLSAEYTRITAIRALLMPAYTLVNVSWFLISQVFCNRYSCSVVSPEISCDQKTNTLVASVQLVISNFLHPQGQLSLTLALDNVELHDTLVGTSMILDGRSEGLVIVDTA